MALRKAPGARDTPYDCYASSGSSSLNDTLESVKEAHATRLLQTAHVRRVMAHRQTPDTPDVVIEALAMAWVPAMGH
jgi:hypothetical protein